jgi:thiol-disulfide isomerase/thioredoxin
MKLVLLIAALTFAPLTAAAQEHPPGALYPTLATGAAAPAFSLPGTDRKIHKLADYAKAKLLVIVFQCNSCPVSQLYEDRIERLYQDYRNQSVALVAINPNNPNSTRPEEQAYSDVSDSLEDMSIRAQYRGLSYPYLYDGEKQAAAMQYGPAATPHIFIFDRDRKLRYQGRIDDNLQESQVTSRDARHAIETLLAGQQVDAAATPVVGCSTRWIAEGAGAASALAALNAEPVNLTKATAEDLKKLRANPTGKLLLVNFWATWCGPCVGEFPELVETYRMYRKREFDMITVSENDPGESAAVLKFLQKNHASSANLLFSSSDTSAMQEAFDPNMGAGVPFTVVITPDGSVVYQEEGEVTTLAMRRAILANLPDSDQYPGMQAYWAAKSEH